MVIDLATMATMTEATAVVDVDFPYIPDLLNFSEIPALTPAWTQLEIRPDVLILDGHGLAHPWGMGIA